MKCINKKVLFSWALYDWAAGPFASIITTFVFATYFIKNIAVDPVAGTTQWANATALAGIVIAFLSPIFGSIADYGGRHKAWLFVFTSLCIIFTALLWFAYPTPDSCYYTLTCVVIATISIEISLVFYNSFLPHIAPPEYLGRLSGWAWGMGYLGGIIALSIMLFFFLNPHLEWLNTQTAAHIRISGPIVAIWYAIFALPLFIFIPDISSTHIPVKQMIKLGFNELATTLRELPQHKNLFLFLLAHLIYIDGLNTLFAFGGIYAAGTFGMDLTHVIIFGISLNVVAGIGAILLGWMDDAIGSKFTILIALTGLTVSSIPLVIVHSATLFWVFALLLAIFVGPVQAASRSLMARIAPLNKSTEMFGLYALSGRITAFVGPWLLGYITYHYNSQRLGMATILLFFVTGSILMSFVREESEVYNINGKRLD